MLKRLITKLVGSRNERLLKQLGNNIQKINELEAQTQQLTDDQLKARTAEFRKRLGRVAESLGFASCPRQLVLQLLHIEGKHSSDIRPLQRRAFVSRLILACRAWLSLTPPG